MSYLDWHVGMKVVCVSANWERSSGYGDELLPEVGRVYTLREVSAGDNDGIVVLLLELHNQERLYILRDGSSVVCEPGFSAENFRPVQTRETDISVFTAMLDGSRTLVSA